MKREDVGRATAGDGGDGIHLRLLVDPDGAADRLQHAFGIGAAAGIDLRQRVQAGDAGADQGRGVGHRAHQQAIAAKPARHIIKAQAGSDADDDLPVEVCGDRGAGLLHLLRLDGKHDDVGRQAAASAPA